MTLKSDKTGDGDPQSPGDQDRVGYGKPPKEHRFKKGRSGNPRGRPRKATVTSRNASALGTQAAKQYLLEEAYRPVLVREGEQTIELPAIQAVLRAMGVAAMKGNRPAQRMIVELVQTVEAEIRKADLDHFRSAVNYKSTWEENIELAQSLRKPEPQPIPHPDDIIIDFTKGTVAVCGPMTKQDKADWDRLLESRDELQAGISKVAEEYRKARNDKGKAEALATWKSRQELYDDINDNLPKRYRKSLLDRCFKDGATLPGQRRKQKWPGED